ncbi:hypothetical protein HIM_04933 [Hirsutella minnesotensis 3608]|uniref:DNA2/NAM7 helicase-like C-terminal domain-containing protein n=1 Tax=Hirsutella minnesotensis 3608 TaxID=1043627 RepID=A0A0F7ZKY5_9HYPO|nr:hypothetical protein HIM_04933 [Hirsutella minnesotensis 3608]
MHNEEVTVKRLNAKKIQFQAWPVAPIPSLTTTFTKSWLLLVKIPGGEAGEAFPSLTDRFSINMESTVTHANGNTFTLFNLPAARIPNPYETAPDVVDPNVTRCAAFKVDVSRSWQAADGVNVELDLMKSFQIASSIGDIGNIAVDRSNVQLITIRFETNPITFQAELAALHRLTQDHRLEEMTVSKRSMNAFHTILDFQNPGWVSYVDLHDEFPQLRNPAHYSHRVPRGLVQKYRAFNEDHRAAFQGMTRMPNGLYFINGCPGAGKTEWNMVLTALIHSKRSPNSRRRHTPILFLVDINKTVDDAANRYYSLCKEVGLKLRVIRMHGWPYEMRNSDKLNTAGAAATDKADAELDFTKRFLATANLTRHTKAERNPNRAPTLDEASWEYYEFHKDDCFPALRNSLTRMEGGEVFDSKDWKVLRSQVATLYRAVLAQADFVATTPVATYGGFSKLFKPDLIFIDEAPHTRELTSLMAIAFFTPLAWIFTGDVKQTRPFVKTDDRRQAEREGLKFNPFADQMRLSTMARAEIAGAINSKLLVNKRGFANLHRLPSNMFYDGVMKSGYLGEQLYPPGVSHLKEYLETLGGVGKITENRVVIRLKGSQEELIRKSFWNPVHHEWVLGQARHLLQDDAFYGIRGPQGPRGTIMIATPYSTAVRQYHANVKQWPAEWQERVEVLTVDKAQGNQADVVILDMVRTTKPGFMDDPHRLNVAITRARQAEIIVMHECMTARTMARGRRVKTQYLSQIWDDAVAHRRLITL